MKMVVPYLKSGRMLSILPSSCLFGLLLLMVSKENGAIAAAMALVMAATASIFFAAVLKKCQLLVVMTRSFNTIQIFVLWIGGIRVYVETPLPMLHSPAVNSLYCRKREERETV